MGEMVLTVAACILCGRQIGAVTFISLLLVMAGIESNPGPNDKEGINFILFAIAEN